MLDVIGTLSKIQSAASNDPEILSSARWASTTSG